MTNTTNTLKYIKFTSQVKNGRTEFTFENGLILWDTILTVGNTDFPTKHSGDVFHLIRTGKINCAADLPVELRNW